MIERQWLLTCDKCYWWVTVRQSPKTQAKRMGWTLVRATKTAKQRWLCPDCTKEEPCPR